MSHWAASLVHADIAIAAVTLVWLLQIRTKNASTVDVVWGLIVGAGSVVYAVFGNAPEQVRWVIGGLSSLWALRLSGYLALRNIGKPEERRYAELRRDWGRQTNIRMLIFFLFQAAIAWLIALSFIPIAFRPDPVDGLWLGLGLIIGLSGILGEGLADAQLARFLKDPANRGKVCDRGLWHYSRHPNYFFDCLHWLAYPCLAVGAPHAWASWIGVIVISFLLLKVSGIPTVEQKAAQAQREGYADYVARTHAFFPWPPKKRL